MEKNRVKITIGDQEYYISADEDVDYILSLGDELDSDICTLMNSNARLSMVQAAILCAFDYNDKYHKAEKETEYIKSQIQVYMEDAAKAKTEAEMAKRDVEKMTRDLKNFRRTLDDK